MTLEDEIAALSRMTTKQLKRLFAELTGDATAANNRPRLIKGLAAGARVGPPRRCTFGSWAGRLAMTR